MTRDIQRSGTQKTPVHANTRYHVNGNGRRPSVVVDGNMPLESNLTLISLFNLGEEMTIQDVMKRTHRSYKTTYYALMRLIEDGYLVGRRRGWRLLFRLNLTNPIVRKHMEIAELERREQIMSFLGEDTREMLEELIEEVAEKIPVLTIIMLNGVKNSGLQLLFVLPMRNGYAKRIKAMCTRNGRHSKLHITPTTKTLQSFRKLLHTDHKITVTLLGTEFYIREKARTINGNGNGNGNGKNGNGNGKNGKWNGNGNGNGNGKYNGRWNGLNSRQKKKQRQEQQQQDNNKTTNTTTTTSLNLESHSSISKPQNPRREPKEKRRGSRTTPNKKKRRKSCKKRKSEKRRGGGKER